MACRRPLDAYRSLIVNPTGKRSTVFKATEGLPNSHFQLPCGQCRWCRLESSRQMAVRCMHEASLWDSNCMVTLTYRDEDLPARGFLDYQAAPAFVKRLRERIEPRRIRTYGCAEYGDRFLRPHFHLLLFNFDFEDKVHEETSHDGFKLYSSKFLDELWPYGRSRINDLTFETAAYVARYVTKKVTGDDAGEHYEVVDDVTGEIFSRPPEKVVCPSLKPGIGALWLDKYYSDVYSHDYVVSNGKQMRPPKYYDRRFAKLFPQEADALAERRKLSAKRLRVADAEYEAERGRVWAERRKFLPDKNLIREEIDESRFEQLVRSFEDAGL